jgi:hypothetical protein
MVRVGGDTVELLMAYDKRIDTNEKNWAWSTLQGFHYMFRRQWVYILGRLVDSLALCHLNLAPILPALAHHLVCLSGIQGGFSLWKGREQAAV